MSGRADARREARAEGLAVTIVAARFHEDVVDALVEGARAEIDRLGGDGAAVTVVWVPGAFEIPVVLDRLASQGGVDALVALACIVRGGTPHFEYVSHAVTVGCEAVARAHGVPVGFGVLTVDDIGQARDRAGGEHGNKGAEAAQAAVETARVLGR